MKHLQFSVQQIFIQYLLQAKNGVVEINGIAPAPKHFTEEIREMNKLKATHANHDLNVPQPQNSDRSVVRQPKSIFGMSQHVYLKL